MTADEIIVENSLFSNISSYVSSNALNIDSKNVEIRNCIFENGNTFINKTQIFSNGGFIGSLNSKIFKIFNTSFNLSYGTNGGAVYM